MIRQHHLFLVSRTVTLTNTADWVRTLTLRQTSLATLPVVNMLLCIAWVNFTRSDQCQLDANKQGYGIVYPPLGGGACSVCSKCNALYYQHRVGGCSIDPPTRPHNTQISKKTLVTPPKYHFKGPKRY